MCHYSLSLVFLQVSLRQNMGIHIWQIMGRLCFLIIMNFSNCGQSCMAIHKFKNSIKPLTGSPSKNICFLNKTKIKPISIVQVLVIRIPYTSIRPQTHVVFNTIPTRIVCDKQIETWSKHRSYLRTYVLVDVFFQELLCCLLDRWLYNVHEAKRPQKINLFLVLWVYLRTYWRRKT